MNKFRTAWKMESRTPGMGNGLWAGAVNAPCPLEFDVQWVTTGAHHNVRVRRGPEQRVTRQPGIPATLELLQHTNSARC